MAECAWSNDGEMLAFARRELFSAVIGDILDMMGYTNQFLPPTIQPLQESFVVCGRAMPVLEADDCGGEGPMRNSEVVNRPFGLMLRALDDLAVNEVYICAGASPTYALWGELMTTCAKNRGAVGAVLDGWARDTRGIIETDFPCFSHGRYAQDQRPRGKVIDFRCRIKIASVEIQPGDIVFGDLEGVVVVPGHAATEVFRRAAEKSAGEKRVLKAIKGGMSAQVAWDEFGLM